MSKEEALKIIQLLSALESWAFSKKTALDENVLPEYLHMSLCDSLESLADIVLERNRS